MMTKTRFNSLAVSTHRIGLAMIILFFAASAAPSFAADVPVKPAANLLSWNTSLKDAYAQALKQKKPILLILGAEWSGPCKSLDEELATPDAARALSRWVRVRLDIDHTDGAATLLQNGTIPLLRILSPTGRRVDFKEGEIKSADLVKWLDATYDQASSASSEALLGTDSPDATSMARLVQSLSDSDASQREAAIKRLLPFASTGAPTIVQTFTKGNLNSRLACLDLLSQWKAPTAGIDPWQPETLTPQRIKALTDWAAAAKTRPASPATAPVALSSEQLEEAQRELSRMLSAPEQEEAHVLRERLARLGKAVLPLVRQALAAAPSDIARQRLFELRYRIAATDALVAAWPGGIERLASVDPKTRHAATEELASRAGPEDGPLLLELFADTDSLVREISLRGLQSVGNSGKALVALLNDPDLNVRAAVLKQLAEAPSAGMLNSVMEFAQKETDPDLVVHAIRVLRESKADRAMDTLFALLGHKNWRVRAEAAEALTEMTSPRSGMASELRQAQVNAAFVKLLDDPDGFVVSRAVLALSDSDVSSAIDAMAKAAREHPELAGAVIRGMVRGNNSRLKSEKYLREFCSSPDPQVRAEAINSLVTVTNQVEKEMKSLLKDPITGVRMVAANSLFTMMNSWRPSGKSNTHRQGGFFGLGAKVVEDKVDLWQWTADFRANKNRPAPWLADVIPDLRNLTPAPRAETRLDAALPLLALGVSDEPVMTIRAAVRAEPRLVEKAAGALPWLQADQRVDLFRQLAKIAAGNRRSLSAISQWMAIINEPQAATAMWDLLADQSADVSMASVVYTSMLQLYFGERYYDLDSVADSVKTTVITDAKAHAAEGSEMQRMIGMAMLLNVSPFEAVETAKAVYQDAKAPPALLADALQIQLVASRKTDGVKIAVAALASKYSEVRRLAVQYLATGPNNMQELRDELYLRFSREMDDSDYIRQGTPVIIEAPPGVTADALKPLIKEGDPATAAYAGYLLVLLGERQGLDRLLAYWNSNPRDQNAQRLVYRAIASLKDDDLTPVLERIYNTYDKSDYSVREFYWTIRIMSGEKILKLRKRIRDEVGMDRLR